MESPYKRLTQTEMQDERQFVRISDYPVAENTRQAYERVWERWKAYCRANNLRIFPANPRNVADFLADSARTASPGTLRLSVSAINKIHAANDQHSPGSDFRVKKVLRLSARNNRRYARKVKALLASDLESILRLCPTTLIGIRDAAVLAVGFAAALRRSEICGLRLTDVEFLPSDQTKMFLRIRQSKTDQLGLGQRVAVIDGRGIRPISHLKRWLRTSRIQDGYLFRSIWKGGGLKESPLSHSDIARLVKGYAGKINLDATQYSGHSLRSGFITSAAMHRARLDKIMEVSRHKSADTVMCYVRDINVFQDHAGKDFL